MWIFEASFNTQRNNKRVYSWTLLRWLPNVQVSGPVGGNALRSKERQSDGQDHIKLAVSDWKVWQPLLSTPDSSSIPTKHSILCLEYIWREYKKKAIEEPK